MLTLYTAVGSLQYVIVNGDPVPHVSNDQKEYGMSKEELLVWSCLAFQILTYPELECLFEKNCADSGQSISLPLSHYLNRLLLRGLLVKGMGVSAVDALYRLLGTLTITPVEEDRKSTRLNSSHVSISYAVFCLQKRNELFFYAFPSSLFVSLCRHPPDLHSFPTRRSSDLKNCADSGQSISLPLSHYLNRLLLRGLLVKGMGVSAVDALYRLLGTLTITPVE